MMKLTKCTLALVLVATSALPGFSQDKRRDEAKKPLVLESQASFFVGGDSKALPSTTTARGPVPGGDITVNQMYVQYQIPVNVAQHVPVVMVHGCCLSSKTWETTPDGRMGWSEYF